MRNDVLQNYLDQFLKCLADNFDNLKFEDASKVAIFRPPNSYILHCHGKFIPGLRLSVGVTQIMV